MPNRMKRIKLTIENVCNVNRAAWPITQGVPFADGDLEKGCGLRPHGSNRLGGAPVRLVTPEGKPLPVQATCLTTWREDLSYVKWLLLDFQLDLPANQTREVFLEYGPGVTPLSPAQPVIVERVSGRTRIDTGAMQVDLRHNDPNFFAACRVKTPDGWRDTLRDRPGPFLYMVDQRGTPYDSFAAAPPPSIAVEDPGPLRVSVCVRGYHASEDGRRFCPYALRIHAYAGKADLRFQHTFVFDQDPERIELSEVGVRFPLILGDGLRMAFGGDQKPHRAERFESGQFLQTSDIEYRVTRDGEPFGSGGKTRGWGSLSGREGSAIAVLKDVWQEYPKGISVDRDGLDVQVWPSACGETLKFSTPWKERAAYFNGYYGDPKVSVAARDEEGFRRILELNPTAPLNLKSLGGVTSREDLLWVEEMIAKHAPGRTASYNDTGTGDGFGAAKTTEFYLRLSPGPASDEDSEALGLCIQEPLIAVADVACACATGALRVIAPFDPERFPEAERGLDGLFERIVAGPRRALRTYGMIDYGDLMCSHCASPVAMWGHFKHDPDVIQKMKHCARSYNNEANDQVYAVWGFYTHTGQRKYFLAADAYGRHMADVDIAHASPDGSKGGLMHYHNCHHWTGGGSPSHTCTAGLMLQYYLTGNRRILDVCREVADWVLAHQEPCGIYSNRNGALVREYSTPVANLLEFYQATWEHKYGDLARRSLKWLLLSMPEPGCFPVSVYTAGARGDEAEVEQVGWHLDQAGGMTPQMLYDAIRIFGDREPVFKQGLVGMAHRFVLGPDEVPASAFTVGSKKVRRRDPYFNISLIAYAYEVTGDPVYAAFCRYYLRERFPEVAKETSFTYVCWGSLIPPVMEAVRRAEAKHGAEALERAEREWVRQVEGMTPEPAPSGRPDRRSVGVVKEYA